MILRPVIRIVAEAITMPLACTDKANVRAIELSIWSSLVNTGKATAPPPCGVEPATKPPKIIVVEVAHTVPTRPHCPLAVTYTNHPSVKTRGNANASRERSLEDTRSIELHVFRTRQ